MSANSKLSSSDLVQASETYQFVNCVLHNLLEGHCSVFAAKQITSQSLEIHHLELVDGLDICSIRLFTAPPTSARSCERELAPITQDWDTVVIVWESSAFHFRRSTWSSVCLVPGVGTALTCRVFGSI